MKKIEYVKFKELVKKENKFIKEIKKLIWVARLNGFLWGIAFAQAIILILR